MDNNNNDTNNNLEYLDNFYNECIINREKHDAVVKRTSRKSNLMNKILLSGGLISFIVIIIGANNQGNPAGNLTNVGFYMFWAVLIFGVAYSIFFDTRQKSRKAATTQSSDGINYSLLDNYLHKTNQNKFAEGNSRCLTKTSVPYTEPPEDVKPVLWTAIPILAVGLLIAYSKFGNEWPVICVCFVSLLFGITGIAFIYVGITKQYLKIKEYNELTDAVCVEINSRQSSDPEDSGLVYQPVFYARCQNGHKYILFDNQFSNINVPHVGDIVQLKVDSSNPLKWDRKNNFAKYAVYFILGAGFAVTGIGVYLWIIFSNNFL